MHYTSIRSHLKPYVIVARRKTTINHAFAAAIAPSDEYIDERVREAVIALGQDPEQTLRCAYCDAPAKTWDHVFATVKNSHFSGYGHRLGNLLPCCKPCNSAKGNKNWRQYLEGLGRSDQVERSARIEAYLLKYSVTDVLPNESPEYLRLLAIKKEVLALFAEADQLANVIRETTI